MGRSAIILLLVPALLEIGLTLILLRRKLYREYPFFFAYITSSILINAARLCVVYNYPVYFKVFWTTETLYSVLGLLALYEVFHWFFFEFYRYWAWFWVLFPGMIVLITALSIWYALEYPPVQASRLISLVLVFGMAVNFVRIGIFLLFFLLVWIFSLRWWVYAFAIVLGFALSALGALAAYWLRSEFGTKFGIFAKYAPPVAYILSVLLWLAVFIRPEPDEDWDVGIDRRRLLEEVRQYTRILAGIRERIK